MKIVEKIINLEKTNSIPENSLFLDIETTGFSRERGRIYLIGTLSKENNQFIFRQFMTQESWEEKELLKLFKEYLEKYETLITFNGESFDFNFIEKRAQRYHIDIDFSNFKSIDIFKKVKTKSFFMEFDNYKLKTLEKFIGIYREDIFSGGDLISLYYEYENGNKDPRLEQTLLLHNEEDILNLPMLFQLLDILKEKNTIYVNENHFEISKINITKRKLEIQGYTNIAMGYLEKDLKKLSIENKEFVFSTLIYEDNYNEDLKCLYTEKDDYNLVCKYNIESPNEIFILKFDKQILYFNIKTLFEGFLNNVFN